MATCHSVLRQGLPAIGTCSALRAIARAQRPGLFRAAWHDPAVTWRRAYTTANAEPAFSPRERFVYPESAPSWYAGHMQRAARSLPSLFRQAQRETGKAPLIIEVRDARLCLTSINPFFEQLLRKSSDTGGPTRRLVVYTKADLISKELHAPIRRALQKQAASDRQLIEDVMFIDTRVDGDVRRVLGWATRRAKQAAQEAVPGASSGGRTSRRLSGAFRHTPTPNAGVRLVILGMPNVGKSSLLNALRRVGIRGRKAVGTAPEPGFTRKLTGTVRITKQSAGSASTTSELSSTQNDSAVYVYDTPGIMVPYLGKGERGIERGLKLAATAGIKASLFDTIQVADYLLFRMNRAFVGAQRRSPDGQATPAYLAGLPLAKDAGPTDDIVQFLTALATRAPGTLRKGGEVDLDAAAQFFITRWREGKVGCGDLDLAVWERTSAETSVDDAVDAAVAEHIRTVHTDQQSAELEGESRNQERKRQKIEALAKRRRQLLADGVKVAPEQLRSVGIYEQQ